MRNIEHKINWNPLQILSWAGIIILYVGYFAMCCTGYEGEMRPDSMIKELARRATNKDGSSSLFKDHLSERGFLFEDSSERLLTHEEVDAVCDEVRTRSDVYVLRYARSELLARHGVLTNGTFDKAFDAYHWYAKKKVKKRPKKAGVSDLNPIEKENYDLLTGMINEIYSGK